MTSRGWVANAHTSPCGVRHLAPWHDDAFRRHLVSRFQLLTGSAFPLVARRQRMLSDHRLENGVPALAGPEAWHNLLLLCRPCHQCCLQLLGRYASGPRLGDERRERVRQDLSVRFGHLPMGARCCRKTGASTGKHGRHGSTSVQAMGTAGARTTAVPPATRQREV